MNMCVDKVCGITSLPEDRILFDALFRKSSYFAGSFSLSEQDCVKKVGRKKRHNERKTKWISARICERQKGK